MTAFNIIDACRDEKVFGPAFRAGKHGGHGSHSSPRCSVCRLTTEQHRIFTECTQRTDRPSTPANEAWLICGRRCR